MIDYKVLKHLNINEPHAVADEIRKEIIDACLKNGGHLASNLGVVELTVALYGCFDIEKDKIVFDVGHQCYTHKILTGRLNEFKNLRRSNGVSGFPKVSESVYDLFSTGHASTSLSLCSGLAKARELSGESYEIVAVIGDGSFLCGQTFEALCDISRRKDKVIIVLNDNGMTISSTGAELTSSDERLGKFFSSLGIEYLGSADGHDFSKLFDIFKKAKDNDGPVALRAVTEKGKGYAPSVKHPEKFHSVGVALRETYSSVFGKALTELAVKDDKIAAITAAMTGGVGLLDFSKNYPERFFDAGICEAHAVTFAAALAKSGYKPFVAIYSTFLQRAYDQLIVDVCLDERPVRLFVDHTGAVDYDGETHQGFYAYSYLLSMPNMTVAAPKSKTELKMLVEFAAKFDKPLAVCYPKYVEDTAEHVGKIAVGEWEYTPDSADITIFTTGARTYRLAVEAYELLRQKGIRAQVVNALFIKPIDVKAVKKAAEQGMVVTIEDGIENGGFGQSIIALYNKENLKGKLLTVSVEDPLQKQASIEEMENNLGLNAKSLAEKIIKAYEA